MHEKERASIEVRERLLRLRQIIGPEGVVPVSKSTWWQGVKDGHFPKPIKIGRRITVWRHSDIEALMTLRDIADPNDN